MSVEPGSRLGTYEILVRLGAGGMGEVYRARDPSLKRDVAIKVLPAYWSRDADRLRRFELEAQAAAALNHPNIVSIFHVGQSDGSPYIVTELLHGETLRDRLCKGPLQLREVVDFGVEIANGLSCAHDAGVVHRDLKPENLFVTKDGRIKILDFGLAKLDPAKGASTDSTAGLTSPGQVMGTVGYMSPEQVRGQGADARSDIFAVGSVLYEMLTGKRAFQKPTSTETMNAVLKEDPPTFSQVALSLPPGLQRIVNRCLAKNPEQRFQHASDLAFALEALSDSSGAAIPNAKHVHASGKRWTWIAATGIVAALVAVVALLWNRLPEVPVVEAVTQLTADGEPKPNWSHLATDGSRVYFNEGTTGNLKVAQVAAIGGATAVVSSGLANQRILGMSPDGSTLLASPGAFNQVTLVGVSPVWEVPVPAGEPRRLASLEAQDGSFAPDGGILFAQRGDLYLAQRDGSNPRKLMSGLNGLIGEPSVSPDGQRIVFTLYIQPGRPVSIFEARPDGSGVHLIVSASETGGVCCARWSPDGSYIVFTKRKEGGLDLWAVAMKTGFFHRSQKPVQLTNGPLSYAGPVVSRDGKRIFAIGTKERGEVVHYDVNLKRFIPFLSGISAFSPTFSSDGKWVTYASYPDHTLWRSRSDGTDRMQLTFPPMRVENPFISPDGKRVVYGNSDWETYVISMDGGAPQKVLAKDSAAANWSPDGSLLVFTDVHDAARPQLQILDLRTGARSIVPESQDLVGGQWVAEDMVVASRRVLSSLVVFNVKTQKWSDLVPGAPTHTFVNWLHSPDYRYLYYTTGGAEPEALRLRVADRKVETITSLKDLRQAAGPNGNTQISVAPDGSAIFTRDIGTQEIYALTVKWP